MEKRNERKCIDALLVVVFVDSAAFGVVASSLKLIRGHSRVQRTAEMIPNLVGDAFLTQVNTTFLTKTIAAKLKSTLVGLTCVSEFLRRARRCAESWCRARMKMLRKLVERAKNICTGCTILAVVHCYQHMWLL